jgi:hypothetical protein
LVTLLGMTTLVKLLQNWNVPLVYMLSMLVTLLGMTTFVRLVKPNALTPIEVTLLGIVTLVSLL